MNRLVILLLLGALLGSCRLFHPYRLPTPPTSPELKAQRKAAERARKQSARAAGKRGKQKADADDAPVASGAAPAATATEAPKEPAKASKLHFDKKTGLMKKPKLKRRIVHKQPRKPFKPFEAFKNLFHRKPKPNAKPHAAPAKADPE
ncbi:hypothetical protein [Hymenobacter sp. PAMC 26628]|uniref:hypothetical protein n=1 Tax=Hymenobacter sp. PAMC 26628 TaxID=1484118 RepID=UPI0012FFB1DE|nr:hypothetical protein [Hymenobacter sp. PAMC 26628]